MKTTMMRRAGLVLLAVGLSMFLTILPAFGQIDQVDSANGTSSSVTITWVTAEAANGRVDYGPTTALGFSSYDPRPDDDVHYVEITGLEPTSLYYFAVVSDGIIDDNGGAFYTFTTAQVGTGIPYILYGNLILEDGATPASGTLVHCTVLTDSDGSELLATLSDTDGFWSLNLGNLKDPLDGSVFSYEAGSGLKLEFEGEADGQGTINSTVTGVSPQDCGSFQLSTEVGIGSEELIRPTLLAMCYPNPFNPRTVVAFSLAEDTFIEISVYNLLGKRIETLMSEFRSAGEGSVIWNGTDWSGKPVSAGIYFCRFQVQNQFSAIKMTLLR